MKQTFRFTCLFLAGKILWGLWNCWYAAGLFAVAGLIMTGNLWHAAGVFALVYVSDLLVGKWVTGAWYA